MIRSTSPERLDAGLDPGHVVAPGRRSDLHLHLTEAGGERLGAALAGLVERRDPDARVERQLLLPDAAEQVADTPSGLLAEEIPAGDVERRLRVGGAADRRLHARIHGLDLAGVGAEDRPGERLEDGARARPEAREKARREDALLAPADAAAVGLDPHDRRVLLAGDASTRHGERPARVRVAHGVDVDPPDPAHVGHRGTIAAVDDQVILYTLNTEARTPT